MGKPAYSSYRHQRQQSERPSFSIERDFMQKPKPWRIAKLIKKPTAMPAKSIASKLDDRLKRLVKRIRCISGFKTIFGVGDGGVGRLSNLQLMPPPLQPASLTYYRYSSGCSVGMVPAKGSSGTSANCVSASGSPPFLPRNLVAGIEEWPRYEEKLFAWSAKLNAQEDAKRRQRHSIGANGDDVESGDNVDNEHGLFNDNYDDDGDDTHERNNAIRDQSFPSKTIVPEKATEINNNSEGSNSRITSKNADVTAAGCRRAAAERRLLRGFYTIYHIGKLCTKEFDSLGALACSTLVEHSIDNPPRGGIHARHYNSPRELSKRTLMALERWRHAHKRPSTVAANGDEDGCQPLVEDDFESETGFELWNREIARLNTSSADDNHKAVAEQSFESVQSLPASALFNEANDAINGDVVFASESRKENKETSTLLTKTLNDDDCLSTIVTKDSESGSHRHRRPFRHLLSTVSSLSLFTTLKTVLKQQPSTKHHSSLLASRKTTTITKSMSRFTNTTAAMKAATLSTPNLFQRLIEDESEGEDAEDNLVKGNNESTSNAADISAMTSITMLSPITSAMTPRRSPRTPKQTHFYGNDDF